MNYDDWKTADPRDRDPWSDEGAPDEADDEARDEARDEEAPEPEPEPVDRALNKEWLEEMEKDLWGV